MKLKAMYDSEDKIPSEVRDYYEERDSKFYLALEGIRDHHEVSALSNAYKSEQAKRREATAKLQTAETRLEGLPADFNQAAYDELVAKAEAGEGKDVDERITTLRTQHTNAIATLETKHRDALAKKDEEITGLKGSIERSVIDSGLSAAMDEANIDPKHKKAVRALLRSEGKFKVVDEDGKPVAMVETDMGEVPLAKFVSDWAGSDDGKEYVGKPAGLGSLGSDLRKGDTNPFAKATWSKTEQSKLVSSDRAKAERLAKSAGFKNLNTAIASSRAAA